MALQKRPLAIDLFAGCGGMSLGLEAAGFDIAGAVEIDPIHALVHHFNFPYGVTLCEDISQLNSDDLKAKIAKKGFKGEIDLIAGGPPCQGFSLMGKRQIDDPRNQLVFEYLRIIKELQPKYFIFENVAGIAAGEHKQFLIELIDQFEKIGYQVTKPFQVLDASLYSAPQKRKRLFLIGNRQDVKPIQYPQFSSNAVKSNRPLTTVAEAIADLAKIPVYQGRDQGISMDKLDYSGFRKNFSPQNLAAFKLCHRRSFNNQVWGHLGSKHTAVSTQRFAITSPGKIEKVSRFLRLDPAGLSNTLRAGTPSDKGAHTAPRPIHYQEPRCISIREAARLHTFPDWFQFHRTIWHGFREVGNAVIPILAKQIGDEIIQSMEINTSRLKIKEIQPPNELILSYKMGEACKYWQISPDTIPKRRKKEVNALMF
jgi:DNA (cytosine-5)-methyltransferase 1